MADNVTLPGTGTTVAADDVGGVLYQRFKQDIGGDGVSVPFTDPATQTTLAAVLAKLTSDPATQTTLAAILAKLIASPATEATLALIKAKTDNLDVALSTRTKPADVQAVSLAASSEADGHSATLGATTNAEATGDGTVVAILKRIRTLLGGTLTTAQTTGASASVSQVSVGTSSTALKTGNTARLGLILYNSGSATVYVKFGSSVTIASSNTFQLAAGQLWSMPTPCYNGVITGIVAASTNTVQVTEW